MTHPDATFDPVGLLDLAFVPRDSVTAWLHALVGPLSALLDAERLGCWALWVRSDGSVDEAIAWPRTGGAADLGTPAPASVTTAAVVRHWPRGAPALGYRTLDALGTHGLIPEADARGGACLIVPGDGDGRAVFACPRRAPSGIDVATSRMYCKLALLLGVSLRRGTLQRPRDASVTAFDASIVSEGVERPTNATRCAVRDVASRRARGGQADVDTALRLWCGLVTGRWMLVDQFDNDGRRIVVVRRRPISTSPALSLRQRQVLFYTAAGWSYAEVGYALGLSESSVSTYLRRAFHTIGVASRAEWISISSWGRLGQNETRYPEAQLGSSSL